MKFTRFFSVMIKHQGNPHFSQEATCRMFNLVFLEGKITAYEEAKKSMKNHPEKHRFDLRIAQLENLLKHLTANKSPDQFIFDLKDDTFPKLPKIDKGVTPWPEYDPYERFKRR